MNLELTYLAKQADQSAPGIHLCLPPQGWDYRCSCAWLLCEHQGSELRDPLACKSTQVSINEHHPQRQNPKRSYQAHLVLGI